MKRIFCLVCVFVIFCGCKGKNVKPVTENIEFVARFNCENTEYVCKCLVGTNGKFTAKFLEPQTVKDLEYVYTENDFSANFKGLTYKADSKKSAFLGTVNKMYSAFCDAATKTATMENNEFEIKGEDYKIYFAQTGLPVKFSLDTAEIEIFDVKQR